MSQKQPPDSGAPLPFSLEVSFANLRQLQQESC